MKRLGAFAFLWFVAGYLAVTAIGTFTYLPLTASQGGLVGLLLGLMWLASITRNERGRRLFYDEPAPDEDGDPWIGCLWWAPVFVIIVALIFWLTWLLL